jgi:hypothetical protein
LLALAVLALACVGDLVRPAMVAGGDGQCFDGACPDVVRCGQAASPSVSSTSAIHPVPLALIDAVPRLMLETTPARCVPTSTVIGERQPVAPFAPRSPPLA